MIIGNPLLELFDLNTTGSKTPNEQLFENFDRGKGIPNASLFWYSFFGVCDLCIWFTKRLMYLVCIFLWTKVGRGRDRGAKIQIKSFVVFSTPHFAPPAFSSDINQPGTIKNHKTKPGIMKNGTGKIVTIETDLESWKTDQEPWITIKNQPGIMKTGLEPWKP